MSHGNFICASAAYMAFNWDIHGSNLAVLPVDTKGRQNKSDVPLIYAHGDFVTDLDFSPFDDGLLATGSQDSTVNCAVFIGMFCIRYNSFNEVPHPNISHHNI